MVSIILLGITKLAATSSDSPDHFDEDLFEVEQEVTIKTKGFVLHRDLALFSMPGEYEEDIVLAPATITARASAIFQRVRLYDGVDYAQIKESLAIELNI